MSRFERGRTIEFGSHKLLALLAVLGHEVQFTPAGVSGSLEELRRERGELLAMSPSGCHAVLAAPMPGLSWK